MQVIPVIDLMGGIVVHAMRGNREHYAAIQSRLAASAQFEDILAGFLKLYPFRTIYIADIDAIQQQGHHLAQVLAAKQQFPELTFWLDAGWPTPQRLDAYQQASILPVIGSESMTDPSQLETLHTSTDGNFIFSLDFHRGVLRGPAALAMPAHWPQQIICMQLDRVGNQSGPDVSSISPVLRAQHAVYAAGGIRSIEDIQSLANAGIAGVLLATALHDGSINSEQLKKC